MVKYAETEWIRKQFLTPEERILINPIDPVYKQLLEQAQYQDREIIKEVRARLEEKIPLYNLPEKEVLYQLFPIVSVARKGSHSREASLVLKMVLSGVKERLWFALDNQLIESDIVDTMKGVMKVKEISDVDLHIPREDAFRIVSGNESLQYAVRWCELSDYDLVHFYITEGWIPLTRSQLIEVYLLLLEKSLKDYIDQKKKEYSSQEVTLPSLFVELQKIISSKVPAVSVTPVGATELEESFFPPCVREALHGASSGLRNYAITVLLTAFLSYARVYPSPKAFDQEKKPEISTEQAEILLQEVVPLIEEAGDRCDPPLFKDQPIEKLNIYYHLGFGLTDSPPPSHFGTSKWYLPPSCQKVKQNAPSLCKPDKLCLEGIYVITKKDQLQELIDSNRGDTRKVLEALRKTRAPQKVSEQTGASIGEVKRIFRNLQKEGILFQIRVKNPLMYYVRKMKRKKWRDSRK